MLMIDRMIDWPMRIDRVIMMMTIDWFMTLDRMMMIYCLMRIDRVIMMMMMMMMMRMARATIGTSPFFSEVSHLTLRVSTLIVSL